MLEGGIPRINNLHPLANALMTPIGDINDPSNGVGMLNGCQESPT